MKTPEEKLADLELYRRLMDLGAELYRIRGAIRELELEYVNLLDLRSLRKDLVGLQCSAQQALRLTDAIVERLEKEEE
jgi:hypothetical protein